MSATVWVYPEKKYEKLGAVRWQLSWEDVKASAKHKLDTDEDWDHDADIESLVLSYATKEAAMKRARKIVDSGETAYGQVTVTRQVVDWYVEEDRIAEWADTNDKEYVD